MGVPPFNKQLLIFFQTLQKMTKFDGNINVDDKMLVWVESTLRIPNHQRKTNNLPLVDKRMPTKNNQTFRKAQQPMKEVPMMVIRLTFLSKQMQI